MIRDLRFTNLLRQRPLCRLLIATAIAALSTFTLQPSTAFAQGSLTPPGPPAPTMKTLAQIEPRAPISSAPFTITNPGSYYLTTNVTVSGGDAITIASSGVTLDLNGFTISSTAPSATGTGILLTNVPSDVTICNGHIRGGVTNNGSGVYSGSGFSSGINSSAGNSPMNIRISAISVSGCLQDGINNSQGSSTVAESCTAQTVGGIGIAATTVKGSVALDCGSTGIQGSQVSDCFGQATGVSGYGVLASIAQNCYGLSMGTNGYGVFANSTVLNCSGLSFGAGGTGVFAVNAENCDGSATGGTSISATTAKNCRAFAGYGSIAFSLNAGGTLIGCLAQFGLVGISAGNGCTIRDCTATQASGVGISVGMGSIVTGCTVQSSSNTGVIAGPGSTITRCTVQSSGNSGIWATNSTVEGCRVLTNGFYGIYNLSGTVSGCTVQGSFYSGIFADGSGGQIIGNNCSGNNLVNGGLNSLFHGGILVNGSNNRVENNQVTGNGFAGIFISTYASPPATNNVVVKNTVAGNGANNYYNQPNNDFGPIGTASASTSPWANISH